MKGSRFMKKSSMLIIMIAAITLAIAVILSGPAHGKKKDSDGGLKKVIAIGNVDMGQMGFGSMEPGTSGDMFRQRAKSELEKTGRYVVVLPKHNDGKKKKAKKQQEVKTPTTAAEAQQYMTQMMEMQKQFQKDAARMQGKYVHEPVAAQGLFNFIASKGGSGFDTGGVFSTAESFGAPTGIGNADFSTDSIKVELTCLQLDPESGTIVDQHRAKASTVRMTRITGANYYTMENSANPDRAFDSMFRRALGRCAKWIDKRMRGQPWEGEVFKAKGGELFVNAGSNAGIAQGMTFDAFSRQELSGGGISVGAHDVRTGTVQIDQVFDTYSLAKPISGTATEGSVLKRAAN